jgi:hypothetical protein
MASSPLGPDLPQREENQIKPEKGPFWRKQENSVKRGVRLRVWQATKSDGDALQMPYVPNEMKGCITNTTSDPTRSIRDEFVEYYNAID